MNQETANDAIRSETSVLFSLPIDREFQFSNHKGIYKKGIEKRQSKLLKKIAFIKPFLRPDEKILLVTTGVSPISILEQIFTGWIVFYLKRSIFVLTNRRIFHIPTTMGYSYRNTVAQIVFADCDIIQVRGRGLVVKYKSGHEERFLFIPRRERKKIKTWLSSTALHGEPSKAGQRGHLCPRCTNELENNQFSCPNCRLEFKTQAQALKLSLLFPGGGYFYTRHPVLGLGDAFVEGFLLIVVIGSMIDMINGVEGGGFGVVFFGIILVMEKALTVYHAHHFVREYIPVDKEIRPLAGGVPA